MVVDAGADAVGLVVDTPESSRNLSLDKAKEFISSAPVFIDTVAVTVFKSLSQIEKIYKELNPCTMQIHGLSGKSRVIRDILPEIRMIRAFQAETTLAADQIVQAAEVSNAVLIDSYHPGSFGGTGRTHDWRISRHIREAIYPKPLILAGGLNPDNVKEAISSVMPFAVDVSSGVESHPGKKDREKVYQFIKKVWESETI
jgi:phosphoribosylanthranilate isomerase